MVSWAGYVSVDHGIFLARAWEPLCAKRFSVTFSTVTHQRNFCWLRQRGQSEVWRLRGKNLRLGGQTPCPWSCGRVSVSIAASFVLAGSWECRRVERHRQKLSLREKSSEELLSAQPALVAVEMEQGAVGEAGTGATFTQDCSALPLCPVQELLSPFVPATLIALPE